MMGNDSGPRLSLRPGRMRSYAGVQAATRMYIHGCRFWCGRTRDRAGFMGFRLAIVLDLITAFLRRPRGLIRGLTRKSTQNQMLLLQSKQFCEKKKVGLLYLTRTRKVLPKIDDLWG